MDDLVRHLGDLFEAAGLSRDAAVAVFEGDGGQALDDAPRFFLAMVDPPGIQELILASRRPTTVRGASATLLEWEAFLRGYGGVVPLYVGGGQGVLLGLAGEADEVERHLRQEAAAMHIGHVGFAAIAVSARDLVEGPAALRDAPADLAALGVEAGGGGGFGALLGRLAGLVRLDKDGGDQALGAAWSGPRCHECGLGEGTLKIRLPGDRIAWRCERCHAFHKAGKRASGDTSGGDATEESAAYRRRHPAGLHDLVDRPAFIAIDGAGVGALVQKCRTLREYVALSRALGGALAHEAIREAITGLGVTLDGRWDEQEEKWVKGHKPDGLVVLSGGDDLLVIVGQGVRRAPSEGEEGADIAGPVEFAIALTRRLEAAIDAHLAARWPDPDTRPTIGFGVGVATGPHISARQGFALARNLLKSAKKRLRSGEARSALDFEVLRTGGLVSENVETLRGTQVRTFSPPFEQRSATFRLGRRPFTLDEAERLCAVAREATESGEVGRGVLYRLRTAFEEDPVSGLATASYLLSRLPSTGLARLLDPSDLVGRPLGQAPVDGLLFAPDPERGSGRRYVSAVPDIVDLGTLVTGRTGGEA